MLIFKKNQPSEPDIALIEAYRVSDDTTALEILLSRYAHLVYGVCMKYLKNEEDAKDASMEIFENMIDDLKNHDIVYFKAWLYSVTKNHCLMRIRKSRQVPTYTMSPEEIEKKFMENPHFMHLSSEGHNPADDLDEVIGRLNKGQRICIRLFYLENKSYKQIADDTGYQIRQVKSHIQNGKRNLQNRLSKRIGAKNAE